MKNFETKVENVSSSSLKEELINLSLLCNKLKNDCKQFKMKELEYQSKID
jgi:hypothetical protein